MLPIIEYIEKHSPYDKSKSIIIKKKVSLYSACGEVYVAFIKVKTYAIIYYLDFSKKKNLIYFRHSGERKTLIG